MGGKNPLSDRIRQKVTEIQAEHPEKVLKLSGQELPAKIELNPDIDRAAFSSARKHYEDLLEEINQTYVTDPELKESTKLDSLLQQLNDSGDQAGGDSRGIKGLLKKVVRRIFRFGFADEMEAQNRINSLCIQSLNEISHCVKCFSAHQRDLNARIARYGQAVVPVLDEKIRYAYESLDKIITENVTLLVERMDILYTGVDKRQTEVLTWLENTTREFKTVLNDFDTLKKESYRALVLQHKKIDALSNAPEAPVQLKTDMPGFQGYTYYLFEMTGRGSEADIKAKQELYLELFSGREPVLDVGCGRGEFLEILRDAGINSTGVDSNADMVGVCHEKGLEVVRGDALIFVANSSPGQWGGIFAAQVVEHFPRDVLEKWIQAAYKAMKPGSVICIETVNTASPFALINHYFRDPTHQLPIHPETYKFLLETSGFENVEIQYTSPVEMSGHDSIGELDELSEETQTALKSIHDAVNELKTFLYAPCDIVISGNKPEQGLS